MAGRVSYAIEHVSRYRYTGAARRCTMLLCLEPRGDGRQRLVDFELEIQPSVGLSREVDCFGNARHVLSIHRAHQGLQIVARSTVEAVRAAPLPERLADGAWQRLRSLRTSAANWAFTQPSELARPSAALTAFVDRLGIDPAPDPLGALQQLSEALNRCFHYTPGSTSAQSPIEHILETGRGVCQDYAHVMIAIARAWGIPARYVSGYLHLAEQAGEQAPDNATHAWVECRLPQLGWVGFDPTNRSLAGERHIRIAVGRDYRDVSPTRGILQGGQDMTLEVDVQVRGVASVSAGGTAA